MMRPLFGGGSLPGLIVVVLILGTGCDSVLEAESEFARVEFRLRRVEGEAFIVNAAAQARPSFADQKSIAFDTLQVRRGLNYEGVVKFFDQDGQDVTSKISTRKEECQLFYTLRTVEGVTIRVADRENEYGRNEFGENLPVGLRFNLFVPLGFKGSQGTLRVQLVEFPNQVKSGVNAVGGEMRIDFDMPLVVNPLPGPQEVSLITRALLTLEPIGGTGARAASVTAVNPAGLHLGASEVDTLRLQTATRYAGRIQLYNDQTGEELTDKIRTDARYYQFVYRVLSFGTLTLDADEDGLTFGQTFTYDLGNVVGFNTGFVRLEQYDPNFGAEKGLSGSWRVVVDIQMGQVVE